MFHLLPHAHDDVYIDAQYMRLYVCKLDICKDRCNDVLPPRDDAAPASDESAAAAAAAAACVSDRGYTYCIPHIS